MRRSLPLLALLLATAAACGRVEDNKPPLPAARPPTRSTNSTEAADSESLSAIPPELPAPRARPSRETGPDLDPAAAPGVAFDYSYAFRLEAERVAEVQQEHQRAVRRATDRAAGSPAWIIAPPMRTMSRRCSPSSSIRRSPASSAARASARSTRPDGTLAGSEISGTEIGTAIKANTGNIEALEAELERVEARLAQRGLRWRERERLDEERRDLRRQIAELRSTTHGAGAPARDDADAVPLRLGRVRAGTGAAGRRSARRPSAPPTLSSAALNMLLIVFVTLSPWLLTALLVWGAIRFARRRLVTAAARWGDRERLKLLPSLAREGKGVGA